MIGMTGEPTQTASKASHAPVYQLSSQKWSTHYTSLPAVFNLLLTSMNREVFEYVASRKIFCYKEEAIMCNHRIPVSKDEWNTKEGTGKWRTSAFYILRYAKSTSQAEATLNSESIKCVALTIVKLRWSRGRQLVSWKFC